MTRLYLIPALLLVLSACSGDGNGVVRPSQSGQNETDGIVSMSSVTTIFQPAEANWVIAESAAASQCSDWGYSDRPVFSGDRAFCQEYDRHGRCIRTRTTRYYQCGGHQ